MGGIPIVQNSTGMWPLFKNGPFLVFNSLLKDHMERNMFVNFELKNPSKQYILAQYWFDKINAYRK